ncbi:MAG: AfsR/SARP family transcriptional regulator [Longimicrobiales bacterium]
MYRLKLLGSPCITGAEDDLLTGRVAQRHRIAMLALLALSPPPGMSRDKLLAYLWPERDTEHARNLLKQAVHIIRSTCGAPAIRTTGDGVCLNTDMVRVDVLEYEAARARSDHRQAVELYRGPFLDGFFLAEAPELQRWIEHERGRLARTYGRALEALAEAADAEHDLQSALEHWQRLTVHDPYDSRVVLRLMGALEAAGNRAAALKLAASHTRTLREELGAAPSNEVLDLAERIRTDPLTEVHSTIPVSRGRPAR